MTEPTAPTDLPDGVESESVSVLVVDDDESVTDLYGRILAPDYDVTVAHGGESALAAADETTDVVLLDRRMPDLSGEAVLTELRNRGLDCRVAMVTAVDPDTDIAEMPFDDYLRKPVDADELRAAVRRLLLVDERERLHLELSSKRVKRNVLQAEKRRSTLANSERFQQLERRIAELEAALEAVEAELDDEHLTVPGAA